jgi:hypothetical protein
MNSPWLEKVLYKVVEKIKTHSMSDALFQIILLFTNYKKYDWVRDFKEIIVYF